MGTGKPKQFTRPPKKQKPKAAAPETADEFQEAADFEENAGGKHRAGDPVKSARAFVRALEIYDKGLQKHPNDFDLAYNKARLQLEISQQPLLVEHIGVPLLEWLQLAVMSHRHALRLREDNADTLFNTAQVLSSLAELLSEQDRSSDAVPLLHEALELLSSCLSRQEIMLEQHRLDFPDTEDGGVPLDPDEQPAPSTDVDMEQQNVIVETPVSPADLIDTVHASLSALTTLVPLADPSGLQTLGDMAHSLTENKAPNYVSLLQAEEQRSNKLAIAMDRAVFIAAFANAQFENHMIELETYAERLQAFDVPSKDENPRMLRAEAGARTELVLAALDRFDESSGLPATLCWKQLTLSQDLYSNVTKMTTEEAQEDKAEVYASKGDIELLRHRLVNMPNVDLSDAIRRSAPTLVQNAQKFYRGASQYAKRDEDESLDAKVTQRSQLATRIEALLYNSGSSTGLDIEEALESCVDEGLVSQSLASALMENSFASRS